MMLRIRLVPILEAVDVPVLGCFILVIFWFAKNTPFSLFDMTTLGCGFEIDVPTLSFVKTSSGLTDLTAALLGFAFQFTPRSKKNK